MQTIGTRARFIGLLALLTLLGVSSAAGWAQGGQGGGFGGGMAGAPMHGDTFSSENILSPGAEDDWPFLVRDGETLILSVTSRNFDPMVDIVGEDGKVVASNDDIRRGEQDALLLHYFPKGGKYKALVKAAKAGGQGEYNFKARRFLATNTPISVRTAGYMSGGVNYTWHRFTANAGQTLVVTARSTVSLEMELVAPNGERVKQAAQDESKGVNRHSFRAATTGAYYVRLQKPFDRNESYALTIALARVNQTEIGQNPPARRLDAGGIDLWNFKGAPGDLIHIKAQATGVRVAASLSYLPQELKEDEPRAPEPPGTPFVQMRDSRKTGNEVVALLNRAGNYQVRITQPLGQEVEYAYASTRIVKNLPQNAQTEAKLALGGSDFWALEGKAGEILRLEGTSEQFDLVLTLYDAKGERIVVNDDGGGGRNALFTIPLLATGRYLLRVESYGDGGSGDYRLRRLQNPIRPLAFDKREQGRLGEDSSEVWSFTGQAGQTIILIGRSNDFDVRLSVRGPDGVEVGGDDDGGDGTNSLLSVRLPLTGVYTLWVFAKQGSGQYVTQLMNAP